MIGGSIEILNYVILSLNGSKKVARDYFGALMNKLIEGVLAILSGICTDNVVMKRIQCSVRMMQVE